MASSVAAASGPPRARNYRHGTGPGRRGSPDERGYPGHEGLRVVRVPWPLEPPGARVLGPPGPRGDRVSGPREPRRGRRKPRREITGEPRAHGEMRCGGDLHRPLRRRLPSVQGFRGSPSKLGSAWGSDLPPLPGPPGAVPLPLDSPGGAGGGRAPGRAQEGDLDRCRRHRESHEPAPGLAAAPGPPPEDAVGEAPGSSGLSVGGSKAPTDRVWGALPLRADSGDPPSVLDPTPIESIPRGAGRRGGLPLDNLQKRHNLPTEIVDCLGMFHRD